MAQVKQVDVLDMEFQYYSSLVTDLVLKLPTPFEQRVATVWFHKLSDPAYNANSLREKRNRYLLMLTICLSMNCLKQPFNKYPLGDALKEVTCIQNPKRMESGAKPRCPSGRGIPDKAQMCDLHAIECPTDDDNIGKVLDEQFNFLIEQAGKCVSKLSDLSDRRRGHKWVTYLSSIDSKCFHMKGVRNDYAMLLSGYMLNEELPGPFLQLPIDKLVPLQELVNLMDMRNHMIIDPSHPKTLKFFRDMPHPEEGAFAFIAVSGEICNSFLKKI